MPRFPPTLLFFTSLRITLLYPQSRLLGMGVSMTLPRDVDRSQSRLSFPGGRGIGRPLRQTTAGSGRKGKQTNSSASVAILGAEPNLVAARQRFPRRLAVFTRFMPVTLLYLMS